MTKPVLKWVGGKAKLIPQIKPYLPEDFNVYHEPFFGGGAMFFHLEPDIARLSDINDRLVFFYCWLANSPERIQERVLGWVGTHTNEKYYDRRYRFNKARRVSLYAAAMFLYLNRACFNGLYRENSKGEFNVPVGRHAKMEPNWDNYWSVVERFKAPLTQMLCQPFQAVVGDVRPGDFVYLDPPYLPVKESDFHSYNAGGFTLEHHKSLARMCEYLNDLGVRFLAHNSDCNIVRDLYRGFEIVELSRSGTVSSGPDRGRVQELLIRNFC